MEKEYELPEESKDINKINELSADYSLETVMEIPPPLTEDELKECITEDELREYMHQYIHELFTNK